MFTLSNVIPIPLKEQNIGHSEVWNTELNILAGKKIFISAPSGKGKTTFQLMLYGIRKDYEGTIKLDGKDIRTFDLKNWSEIRQNKLSIIFQDLRLFPDLTALENIELKNNLSGHKTKEQIIQMAENLGVASFMNKKAGILSYGQRQRMAIIRAMCQPFELLLMDEPFSHLDKENIEKACSLIKTETELNRAGYIIASLGDRYSLDYDLTVHL
jgi:ABC-type lipoprotein export system ATPase subunit